MRRIAVSMNMLGVVVAICLHAAPAQAQATRTWVSGTGDDANPCSRTAPCKTFAGAIVKTAAGGEICVLDPGGFGAVTITKSISIISEVEAGVLVIGTNGIIVNVAATDKVLLEGLDIEGDGASLNGAVNGGLNGVVILGGGRTTIRKCSIRNFRQNGVNLAGAQNARAVIEDSLILNNTVGVNLQGALGAANYAILRNSIVDNSTNSATQTDGPSALVLIGSTLSGSPTAILATGGGTVVSYGNNVIRGAGLPTQTAVLQ
jgi:hypothetical protein